MIWLRRGFVFALSVVLLVSLVVGVAALNVNRDLANPTNLENRLAASGIYDHVVSAALQQAEKSASSNGNSGTVSLSDPAVQQAAASVFSPALVQQEVNAFLNGNYDWLSGKKTTPDYKIDLISAKASFSKQVGHAVQTHLSGLPPCSAQQLAQLPIPVDPLQITCRPTTLDPKAEGDRVAQEMNDSQDFLANPVITASTLNQPVQSGDGSQAVSDQAAAQPGQPYYKRLSWAPTAYQIGTKLPFVLGGLAILSALGIVFVSVTRRRGLRRCGVVLLLAGLILIGLKFLADAAVNKFSGIAAKNALLASLKQPLNELLHKVEPQLVRGYLLFGIAFVIIALAIFVWLFRGRRQAAKPKPSAAQPEPDLPEPDLPAAVADQPETDTAPRPAPHQQATAPTLPDMPASKPAAKRLAPLGKNPPRRKPPKLIQ